MKVRDEIRLYSSDEDKPVLNWLLDRYSYQSQWAFVADCRFERYGVMSYEVRRVWLPTREGSVLYDAMHDKS